MFAICKLQFKLKKINGKMYNFKVEEKK